MADADKATQRVAALTRTLLGIAHGAFDQPTPRDGTGDHWDVLAFLVNSTAQEVELLVQDLERKQDELTQTQLRLAENEKLAALGLLAAGVAHEMNQPLSVLLSSSGLLRVDPERTAEKLDEGLALIAEAARQMAGIVDSVRTYGRAGDVVMSPICPLSPIREAASLLSGGFLDRRIELSWEIGDHLPQIQACQDRLRQVFINLLSNAADAVAMPTPSKRQIAIVVSSSGDRISYRITDSGPGLPPDVAARLFQPFVTTKPAGQGTWLGPEHLPCHRQHPRWRAHPREPGKQRCLLYREAARPGSTVSDRRGILVVEDDPLVRRAIIGICSWLEFDVTTAEDGSSALRALEESRFDLVLTDLRMPGASGVDVARRALSLRAPPALVITSGFTTAAQEQEIRELGAVFLRKPFELEAVKRAIAQALGEYSEQCRAVRCPRASSRAQAQTSRRPR